MLFKLLIAVPSLVAEHWLWRVQTSVVVAQGLSSSAAHEIFLEMLPVEERFFWDTQEVVRGVAVAFAAIKAI